MAIEDRPHADARQGTAIQGNAEEDAEMSSALAPGTGTTPGAPGVEEVAEELRRVREEKKGKEQGDSPGLKRPAAAGPKQKSRKHPAPASADKEAAGPLKRLASSKAAAKKAGGHLKRPGSAKAVAKKAAGPQKRPAAAAKGLKTKEEKQLQLGCRRCRGSRRGCEQCRKKSYGGQRMDRAQWVKLAQKEGLK